MLEIYSRLMTRKYIVAKYMTTRRDEGGASAVEYGLLIALIAAIIAVAVGTLGKTVLAVFTDTNTKIDANN